MLPTLGSALLGCSTPTPPRSLAVWSDPGLGAGWACAAVLHVTFLAPAEKLRFQSTLIDSPS